MNNFNWYLSVVLHTCVLVHIFILNLQVSTRIKNNRPTLFFMNNFTYIIYLFYAPEHLLSSSTSSSPSPLSASSSPLSLSSSLSQLSS